MEWPTTLSRTAEGQQKKIAARGRDLVGFRFGFFN